MNITLALQELDDLIVQHTQPPVTAILRNKLHPLREQIEAYVGKEQERAQLAADIKAQHDALKLAQPAESPHSPTNLNPEELEILKLLATVGDSYITAQEISTRRGLGLERTKLYITRLSDTNLIDGRYRMNSAARYGLATKGREYLFSKGLI